MYRVVTTAREAAAAERRRRVAWEREQEERNMQMQAEMERQIMDMRQQLSMLQACMSVQPNSLPAPHAQAPPQHLIDSLYSTARIEPVSPGPGLSPHAPMSPAPTTPAPSVHPMFVEGSSSRPLTSQDTTAASYSTPVSQYPLSPRSRSHSPPPSLPTPGPEANTRKRTREVLEDNSDYDSDTESDDSDTPATDRPLKRKNGHDGRCLTIHVSLVANTRIDDRKSAHISYEYCGWFAFSLVYAAQSHLL